MARQRFPIISVVVLILGLVAAAVGAVLGFGGIFSTIATPDSFSTPGARVLQLDPGTYSVYERTGSRSGPGEPGFSSAVTLTPDQVVVTDPDGRELALSVPRVNETFQRGSSVFTGVARFEVESAGRHEVEVLADVGEVLVSRSVGSTFRAAAPWIALMVLGGLLALGGVVGTIVGLVRRRGSGASPIPPSAAWPPGWYPDPDGSGRMRYWNGSSWTEHRS